MIVHKTTSLEKLRSLRKPVSKVTLQQNNKLNKLEKVALAVTTKIGTMGFFFCIITWSLIWMAWNTFAPQEMRFDPFPAFELWLFISNLIQLTLLPLLLIGQNLQNRYSESRAESDYEINIKSEREIEVILQHLENQNELLNDILAEIKFKEEKR